MKINLFWSTFGKVMAAAMVVALLIASIELASPVDVTRFPWVKPFDLQQFMVLYAICCAMGTLVGTVVGVITVGDADYRGEIPAV